MLKRAREKALRTVIRLAAAAQNEKGELQTFATIAGLVFVAVMLVWAAYEVLKIFFPNFLQQMLQAIQSKFTIQ